MNELIQSIFKNFEVDGVKIPMAFLQYNGHANTYITYLETDIAGPLSADDELVGYVDYYDFDVYSKGNYKNVIEQLKATLKEHGFTWQPSRSSRDMYETDTGYYHKTLCFAIHKEEF